MHLKMVTLLLKSWQKGSYFLEQFFWAFWLMFKYISFSFFLQFCSEFYLALCFIGYLNEQGVQSLKTSVKTPKEIAPKNNSLFVMILKVGLPSLNAFFSGSKSWNDKVSVTIRKKITCRFQNTPYFYSWCHFYGSYDHLKHGVVFFGTPCI